MKTIQKPRTPRWSRGFEVSPAEREKKHTNQSPIQVPADLHQVKPSPRPTSPPCMGKSPLASIQDAPLHPAVPGIAAAG